MEAQFEGNSLPQAGSGECSLCHSRLGFYNQLRTRRTRGGKIELTYNDDSLQLDALYYGVATVKPALLFD